MISSINIPDIYEQNINFLIGSGATFGLLPTLRLSLKDSLLDEGFTIESLSTELSSGGLDDKNTLLFMHYYKTCIEPAAKLNFESVNDPAELKVLKNYKIFLLEIISILRNRKASYRKCNIYTTNYDGCLENAAESILRDGVDSFILNDGTEGFKKRWFHTKNFNKQTVQKGIFDKHTTPISQLNLLHLHGSVYWHRDEESIFVDYSREQGIIEFSADEEGLLAEANRILSDADSTEVNFKNIDIKFKFNQEQFWENYKKLPIVNPTKWKFHETVFEENYYQLLRHLSFELERPNTVFITFGFSFADEHIKNLVQRSLSNPSLTLYICCFNEDEIKAMEKRFKSYPNVKLVGIDEFLTFTVFNEKVFTTKADMDDGSNLGPSENE